MAETILIVDDEDSVRRTFRDWLASSDLDCEVFAVGGAEQALILANKHPIDLAILDWNLGTGSDGLQLLEDLVEFHPDLIAILVTGFAHQATPLEALRMGVRDYLDKNQDLNRETFLAAVRRQIEKIIPAKRHRQFTQNLMQFRQSVEKILPLVRASALLNDPVNLPEAVRHLFRFLLRTTRSADGVFLAHHTTAEGKELFLAFSQDGAQLPKPEIPFSRSLAATVLSLGEPCVMSGDDITSYGFVDLTPFEKNRRSILAAPVAVAASTHVVLELFDKPEGFTAEDRQLVAASAEFSSELLRQALTESQTSRLLLDAVETALQASESISGGVLTTLGNRAEDPPSPAILNRLREGLSSSANAGTDADTSLRLVEAIRVLALTHGPAAVGHCLHQVESLRALLDEMTGG